MQLAPGEILKAQIIMAKALPTLTDLQELVRISKKLEAK